jgi:hypothetical protein
MKQKKQKHMALQSYWFSVDGVIKSAMTSNRDIAFEQVKKRFPDAKVILDVDIAVVQAAMAKKREAEMAVITNEK